MAGQYNIVYVGTRGTSGRGSSLAPVVQGSTWSPHTITVKYADGSVYSLAGKTVSGTFSRRGETYAITGDLTVTDAANGIFTWDKSAADVGTPGTFAVQFVFAESGETDATFDASMTVQPRADANAVSAPAYVGVIETLRTWLTSLYNSIGAVTGTSENNVVTFDANGIPQDSGVDIALLGGADPSISILTDVTITEPIADNELLAWDDGSAHWTNQTAAEAGIAAASHNHAASDINSGTLDDARVAESNVTQHEAALSITESQISDLGEYATNADLTAHENDTANPHGVTAAQAAALPEDAGIVAVSTTHTLQAGNAGKVHLCDGTFTITLPDGLNTGYQVSIINTGSGTITLAAETTLNSVGSAVTLATQYEMAVAVHVGSGVWIAGGGLE